MHGWQGDQSRWQVRRHEAHSLPTNRSKIHPIYGIILVETGTKTPVHPRLWERSICNWVGQEEKRSGQHVCPWGGTWRKGEHWGRDPSREWTVSLQVGCCRPGVLAGGDEPPLAGGRQAGLAGGLWEGGGGRRVWVCVSECVCACWLMHPHRRAGQRGGWMNALVAAQVPRLGTHLPPCPPPGRHGTAPSVQRQPGPGAEPAWGPQSRLAPQVAHQEGA